MSDVMLLHARKHQGKPPRTPSSARAAATLVDEKTATSGAVTTALSITTVALAVGDQLVLKRVRNNGSDAGTWAAPSGGGLVWTSRAIVNVASKCHAEIFTSSRVTVAGAVTVSSGATSTGQSKSMVVEAHRGAETFDGTQAILQLSAPATTGTLPDVHRLTTLLDASGATWCAGDWAANAPGTPNYGAATGQLTHDLSAGADYVAYHGRQTAPLAGPQRTGVRTPATQNWTLVALEVPGAASGTSTPRTGSEGLTTGDTSTARVILARTPSEGLTTADSPSRTTSRTRTAGEGLTTADTSARATSRPRAAAETLTTADATAAAVQRIATRGTSETLTTADSPSRTSSTTRSTTETLTTVDATSRTSTRPRAAGETLTTADVTSRTSSSTRSTTEALATTDSTAPSTTGQIPRSTSEGLTTADTSSRRTTAARTSAEALTTADSPSRRTTRPRNVGETLTTLDVTLRTAPARTRSTTEILTTSDTSSASTTGQQSRAVAEGLTTTDSSSRRTTRPRASSEALVTVDSSSRRTTRPRALGEALELVDVAARALVASRSILETLELVDAAAAALGLPEVDVVVLGPPAGRQRRVAVGISSPRDVDLGSRPPDPDTTSRRRTVTITGRSPQERR